MTKQMAESLGMNDLDRVKKALKVLKDSEDQAEKDDEYSEEEISSAIQNYDSVSDLIIDSDPDFDKDMDEIAKDADEASKELLALGMNVETKFTAEIVSAAERFKSTQLAAKKAKADRKLKALDLKLKERRLDLLEQKQNSDVNRGTYNGEGEVLDDDRDSILDDED